MFRKLRYPVVTFYIIILLLILSLSLPSLAYEINTPSGPYLALALKAPPTPSLTPTPTATPSYGIILISEVMVQPASSEPDGEWVELYNSGGATITLSSYKLGDEETRGHGEGMFQFPMGASLAPGQVIIIAQNAANFHAVYGFNPDFEIAASSPVVPDMRKVLSWASGTISLENNGDEVLLLDGADLLADALSWGNSSWAFYPPCPAPLTEWSLERYPVYIDTNTSNDWRTQPIPTPGTVNLTPPTPTPSLTPTRTPTPTTPGGGLLVSEVLYDPFSAEPAGEWIELYNASGETIDLANYKVGDEVVPGNPEGMYQFPSGASIETGQVIIVADRADVFTNTYGFYPDYEYIDSDGNVPDMSKYIPWAIWVVNLSNPGDEVLVLDENDYFEDAISWGDSNWAFDPPCPVIAEGHSLERYPAEVDTDTAADWIDQAVPNPGQVNLY